MNGENPVNERIARLEQRVVDLEGQVDRRIRSVEHNVNALTPVIATVATLSERIGALREDLGALRQNLEERESEGRAERRSVRLAMWSMAGTVLCALIGSISYIVVSSVH